MKKAEQKLSEPAPRARREREEYDPNLDFTKMTDDDAGKPKPND